MHQVVSTVLNMAKLLPSRRKRVLSLAAIHTTNCGWIYHVLKFLVLLSQMQISTPLNFKRPVHQRLTVLRPLFFCCCCFLQRALGIRIRIRISIRDQECKSQVKMSTPKVCLALVTHIWPTISVQMPTQHPRARSWNCKTVQWLPKTALFLHCSDRANTKSNLSHKSVLQMIKKKKNFCLPLWW